MTVSALRRLVSIADAAEMLAVSPKTIRRLLATRQLEGVRIGRKALRVKIESIEGLINNRPAGS